MGKKKFEKKAPIFKNKNAKGEFICPFQNLSKIFLRKKGLKMGWGKKPSPNFQTKPLN